MSDLKKIYKTLQKDPFPQDMRILLGDQELRFAKKTWTIDGEERGLRYGENPDQPAALYTLVGGGLELDGISFRSPEKGLVAAISEEHMLQAGKHPGKINLTDVDNGANILQYLSAKPACVILKHNNPCGAAWDESLATALDKAFMSDRIAAFGGTVVVNRPLDTATAKLLTRAYFEVVAAPDYEEGSLELLKQKSKNLRILRIPGLGKLEELAGEPFLELKSLIDGGIVAQFSFRNRILAASDFIPATAEKDGVSVAARAPSAAEAEDLLFAWAVESGVTSNSVIFVKDGATTAIGTGEQDRVGCVELAIHKAYTKYADRIVFEEKGISLYEVEAKAKEGDEAMQALLEKAKKQTEADKAGLAGSVLVSDGFFPFRDGVDVAMEQGVTAIAQPGGSIRDTEVIQAVNEATPQVAMVFTGQRSFRH